MFIFPKPIKRLLREDKNVTLSFYVEWTTVEVAVRARFRIFLECALNFVGNFALISHAIRAVHNHREYYQTEKQTRRASATCREH